MLTPAMEDYLKTIYQLQHEGEAEPVSTSALAGRLAIRNASVTGMLKKLSSLRPSLVDYEPYAGVTLSPEGERKALEIIRHHRLIESFLNQKLGYTWDKVHAEADRLEHAISEDLEDHLAAALENPRTDPHGEPIPDRDGHIEQPATTPLSEQEAGATVVIQRVAARDPELLRYLQSLGLNLNTRIEVTGREPFNGPTYVRLVEAPEKTCALGQEVSGSIFVIPVH